MPSSWLLVEQPVLVQRFDEKVTRISVAGLRCGRWTPINPASWARRLLGLVVMRKRMSPMKPGARDDLVLMWNEAMELGS